ncbi:hypothetical protein SDC9_141564 [bioreactor metagenome]|uniref:Uncharacterized protein n=1 Tax=bioreactor metagenome TaxID=1076179 RepID=A0A645DZ56_9ZZZZ
MDQLAGILFNVNTGHTDALDILPHQHIQITMLAQGYIELRDLVCLGQVRVKVVFAVLLRHPINGAVQRMAHFNSTFDHLLVEHRQRAGVAHANRAAKGIDLGTKPVFAATENFCFCVQLGMYFKADDGFKVVVHLSLTSPLPQSRQPQSRSFSPPTANVPR